MVQNSQTSASGSWVKRTQALPTKPTQDNFLPTSHTHSSRHNTTPVVRLFSQLQMCLSWASSLRKDSPFPAWAQQSHQVCIRSDFHAVPLWRCDLPPHHGCRSSVLEMDLGGSNAHPITEEELPQLTPWSMSQTGEDKEDGCWGQRRAYASPREPMGVSASQASHIPRISWQGLRFLPLKERLEPVLGNQVSLTMAQTCLGKGCVSHPNCTTHLPVKLVRPRQSLPDLLSQPAGWGLGSHGATNTGLTSKGPGKPPSPVLRHRPPDREHAIPFCRLVGMMSQGQMRKPRWKSHVQGLRQGRPQTVHGIWKSTVSWPS